jgi:hypothetical protein
MTSTKKEDSVLLHEFHLNEDDLADEAKRLFPFHTEILQSLNYCGRRTLTNNLLSEGGKHVVGSELM